ncbi:U1 small nuclear ribonucleoprotein component PRP42 [Nakaseomyces bracarensis]|uniref:U1 small nuclear ribonucleoprotein component PRP42 n=1 Tax=Nakaseomyces bracarensis TaxID=273131 RepID=A0ABR4NU81_9SACH
MQGFEELVNSNEFASYTLEVAKYPKTLLGWEKLINLITKSIGQINKAIDVRLYRLLKATYKDFLFYFPLLENYYIDYGLLEYKLGHFKSVHIIFKEALGQHNNRSILIWINYLRLCNEIVIDQKQLLKKYERAEQYIGMHYLSGEFWEMYLRLIRERSNVKIRYYATLRKVIEIPLHSFSKFYALWLRHIDEDIKDLKHLLYFASKDDIKQKFKLDLEYKGRRGPYLIKAKQQLKKFTKELYSTVQYQVMEIYSLFENKITIHHYTAPDELITSDQQVLWDKYLDYIIELDILPLTQLVFQRGIVVLAHYDFIWLKYAKFHMERLHDMTSARNILIRSLQFSLRKKNIIEYLTIILINTDELPLLDNIFTSWESSIIGNAESSDDFPTFWNFIEFKIFYHKSLNKSRYSESVSNSFLPDTILEKIYKRLEYQGERTGQDIILSNLVGMQTKDNTEVIENKVFKEIIQRNWSYYLDGGLFWYLYSKLIFFDHQKSYLERRGYIVEKIWKQIPKKAYPRIAPKLLGFCESYLPDDIDIIYEMIEQ